MRTLKGAPAVGKQIYCLLKRCAEQRDRPSNIEAINPVMVNRHSIFEVFHTVMPPTWDEQGLHYKFLFKPHEVETRRILFSGQHDTRKRNIGSAPPQGLESPRWYAAMLQAVLGMHPAIPEPLRARKRGSLPAWCDSLPGACAAEAVGATYSHKIGSVQCNAICALQKDIIS